MLLFPLRAFLSCVLLTSKLFGLSYDKQLSEDEKELPEDMAKLPVYTEPKSITRTNLSTYCIYIYCIYVQCIYFFFSTKKPKCFQQGVLLLKGGSTCPRVHGMLLFCSGM